MEVSQAIITGIKRRQPCSVNSFGDQQADQSKKMFTHMPISVGVGECNCNPPHKHTHCADRNQSYAKRSCSSGVSSLHNGEAENQIPVEMQYDFFAMQCNNNSSAINLNTAASQSLNQLSNTTNTQPNVQSEVEMQMDHMDVEQYRQMIPSNARRCQRCISGEPGHINHILSTS